VEDFSRIGGRPGGSSLYTRSHRREAGAERVCPCPGGYPAPWPTHRASQRDGATGAAGRTPPQSSSPVERGRRQGPSRAQATGTAAGSASSEASTLQQALAKPRHDQRGVNPNRLRDPVMAE